MVRPDFPLTAPLLSKEIHVALLRQNGTHDLCLVYVCEALVAGVVPEGQALKIQPQQLQQGGVEVGDGDNVLRGVVAELIGSSVRDSAFDSAARHPEAEAA